MRTWEIVQGSKYRITQLLVKRQRLKAESVEPCMVAAATPSFIMSCFQQLGSPTRFADTFIDSQVFDE